MKTPEEFIGPRVSKALLGHTICDDGSDEYFEDFLAASCCAAAWTGRDRGNLET